MRIKNDQETETVKISKGVSDFYVLCWPKKGSKVVWVAVLITQPLTTFFLPAEYVHDK